ncbi:C40 family peptidase [Brevibacillus migulae]|uniref:C40 family peptidase n=1 Tax=Brevibacillus migulae TaxID=1644114 RepID=UPI00106EDAE3|nr:C40 family peptidase [Brevibacillus migulae]
MTLKKRILNVSLAVAFVFTGVTVTGQDQAAYAYSASKADKVIEEGKDYLHTPYKFGASSSTTKYFDCSSFVQRVYKSVGVKLLRSSRQQATQGTKVLKSQLKKGDLIFMRSSGSSSNRITHVAIYAGNNKILHTYGKPGVTFSTFKGSNWEKRMVTARRVL